MSVAKFELKWRVINGNVEIDFIFPAAIYSKEFDGIVSKFGAEACVDGSRKVTCNTNDELKEFFCSISHLFDGNGIWVEK